MFKLLIQKSILDGALVTIGDYSLNEELFDLKDIELSEYIEVGAATAQVELNFFPNPGLFLYGDYDGTFLRFEKIRNVVWDNDYNIFVGTVMPTFPHKTNRSKYLIADIINELRSDGWEVELKTKKIVRE